MIPKIIKGQKEDTVVVLQGTMLSNLDQDNRRKQQIEKKRKYANKRSIASNQDEGSIFLIDCTLGRSANLMNLQILDEHLLKFHS